MKMCSGFKIVTIVDEHLVVPVGETAITFKGVVALSEAAYFLLNTLQEPKSKDDLLNSLIEEFEIDEETAREDIDKFINQLLLLGVIEE